MGLQPQRNKTSWAEGERGHTQTLISSFSLSVVVLLLPCLLVLSSRLCCVYGTPPPRSSSKFGVANLGRPHITVSCPNSSIYSLLSLIYFYGPSPLELPSANHKQRPIYCWYISIANLVVCCYSDQNPPSLAWKQLTIKIISRSR